MSRDILKRLSDASLVALCLKGDEWPRAMLSSCLIPDGWMGLIERPDGGRRFVPAGEDPRPESTDTLLLVRNRAITIPLELDETAAADKHVVSARGEVLVRWKPEEHDLAALRRSLMHEPTLGLERLAKAVTGAGTFRTLRDFARSRSAEELAGEDLREEFAAALSETLKRFLFESGLMLDRVAKLSFASATLAERERLEREAAQRVRRIAAREQVEQAAAAATIRRLDDLSGVLEKLQAAARADTDLCWHDLLPTLSPPDRTRLLENLWRITPNRQVARHIVAVAGRECLWLDPERPAEIAHRLTFDEQLGALRSVTWDSVGGVLLIGAASGLWSVDADGRQDPQPYAAVTEQPPRTGFNAAAQIGNTLFGTHSELGCWMWDVGEPAAATPLLQPAHEGPHTIRAVTAVGDGRVAFAADACVHIHDPVDDTTEVLSPATGTIQSLAVLGDRIYAGTSDGHLLRADLSPVGAWITVHRTFGAIESIAARCWNDLVELVIPAADRGIGGVFGDEAAVTRLLDASVSIRRAWATDDLIVGLTDRRDRLVVLNANRPGRDADDVPLSRLVGRSIQDACIVATTTRPPAPAGTDSGES